jgi:hypothetical protein
LKRAWRWLFPARDLALELTTDASSAVTALLTRTQPAGWRSLFRTGVVGRIDERRVRLHYQRAWSRNDFAPVFVGHFEVKGGRTYLIGTFAPSLSTRVFLSVWLGFILLWWVGAFVATVSVAEPGIPLPIVLVGPPLMISFGIGLARFGGHFARSDADRIEAELREALALRAG